MWFTENAWPPILIAAVVAMIFFAVWNIDRRNLYFFLAIGCLGMMGVFYVFERVFVTEGERVQSDVVVLCHEFQKQDQKALAHFSDQAPELKELCKAAMEMVHVADDMNLTDFQTTLTNHDSRADVHFRANATIAVAGLSGHHPFRCVLTYQKESGVWKIIEVQRLNPINGDKIEAMANR